MKVAIFLNSGTATTRTVTADKVICADGGFNLCPLTPDYIIGDCDSIDLSSIGGNGTTIPCSTYGGDLTMSCPIDVKIFDEECQIDKKKIIVESPIEESETVVSILKGVALVKHDTHKNFTDGESAVYLARDLGATDIDFYGVLGGRYDHTLGNFAIMALADKLNISAVAREDNLDIYFANGEFSVSTKHGDLISVLPYGGEALVGSSANLEYPLEDLLLTSTDTRGISNISQGGIVQLRISHGSAIVFHYTHI